METIGFLGCSRGLGRAVIEKYRKFLPEISGLAVARKIEPLQAEFLANGPHQWPLMSCDFSKEEQVDGLLDFLDDKKLDRIFYFAGGGPFGLYGKKNWKDHQWSLNVNFITPAKILHWSLSSKRNLKQIVFIGSAVADNKADPLAASYCAGKHGLLGLISSVIKEKPEVDLRIFRPGYMDTDMLTKNAKPRTDGSVVMDPMSVATDFVTWVNDQKGKPIFNYGE